jgi:hypothetical protein
MLGVPTPAHAVKTVSAPGIDDSLQLRWRGETGHVAGLVGFRQVEHGRQSSGLCDSENGDDMELEVALGPFAYAPVDVELCVPQYCQDEKCSVRHVRCLASNTSGTDASNQLEGENQLRNN